ncbi:MAG: disulfide bond formation protein B [Alphaproteobacteria bacterium]|jgi:disulfide bond formation protein DsbB|nr:disulfide bond formation protein B [Alphaproteobacteria bacterium]
MNKNTFASFIQFIASGVLLSSFSLEFFFNVAVCNLCLIQRALWVFLILITTFIKNKGIILLIILAAILVSAYHVLLQYGIVHESQVCAINFDFTNTRPSCELKDFEIFHLPLSVYNFLINIVLFMFVAKYMNRKKEVSVEANHD